jgi:hypothetical protein
VVLRQLVPQVKHVALVTGVQVDVQVAVSAPPNAAVRSRIVSRFKDSFLGLFFKMYLLGFIG